MRQLEWNNRIGIIGTSRTGKSWLLKYIIKQYIKMNKRRYYILIDDKMSNVIELEKQGFYIQEINKDNIDDKYSLKKFIKHHEKVVFLINGFIDQAEIHKFLNRLAFVVYHLKDALFCIDEAHAFLPSGKYEPKNIVKLERGGAKDGIDFIISTHRITDVSPDVVSLLNVIISFRVNEPNTRERLAEFFDQFSNPDNNELIDQDLDRQTKKRFKEMLQLKNPEFILPKLKNREFLYADLPEGIQQITSSNLLS
jgi:DNA helicase HerA-like ATPase